MRMEIESKPKKKSILLFMPDFFQYPTSIVSAFEKKGYSVYFFSDRPSKNKIVKSLIRINRRFCRAKTRRYLSKIIRDLKETNIDYVIVIEGQSFIRQDVIRLKKAFKEATFVFLLWDALSHFKETTNFIDLFNKKFSFSKKDINKYPYFSFLPDFFDENSLNVSHENKQNKYDFCYIGTAHPKKHNDLIRMVAELEKHGYKGFVYEYLPSRLYYFYCKFLGRFRCCKISDFHYEKISFDKVSQIIAESTYILDTQGDDAGLTMRTFDCLYLQKKIITTNPDIENYDFYNPKNIYLLKNKPIDFSAPFFSSAYEAIDMTVLESYSLSSWCDTLIGLKPPKSIN